MSEHPDILTILKIVVIGDYRVGKTSLLTRLIEDTFDPIVETTEHEDLKEIILGVDGHYIKLFIWDTAWNEAYRTRETPAFYSDVHGAVLVYDVTRYHTFFALEYCLGKLKMHCSKNDMVKMIVGNKIDDEARQVSKEMAEELAMEKGVLYAETSGATGTGVDAAFEELIRKIIDTPGLWESYAADNTHTGDKDHPPQSGWASYCSLL